MDRWFLRLGSVLEIRHWGEESVVFDADHAATHLLNELAAEVLRALSSTPSGMTAPALWTDLFGERAPVELDTSFVALLDELRRIRLVEVRADETH